MYMTFGCNPNFCHFFFTSLNFKSFLGFKHIDTRYLVNPTPPTILPGCFFKLSRCFCQGLKMCMRL